MVHFIVLRSVGRYEADAWTHAYRYSTRRLFLAVCNAPFAPSVCLEDEVVQRKSKGAHGGGERERQKYTRSCSSWTDT